MIAMPQTDRYPIVPRLNAVSDVAYPQALAAIVNGAPPLSRCAKHPAAIRFSRSGVPGTNNRSCTSRPAAALKSP